ncbi:metal ABC transporter permease [Salinispora arenicola]|uniref:ABC transporter n=2 Tax=Salinispora arenicola TaxID=168697 RepID=A0A542XPD0_SALAC|nr:metal ABC transporter permease [Salinispora arenicola]MCN0150524.1 metal ABC transporter permease [Salinispora arenicola]MCN0179628.1 metal ABC transporter permease [Salinispora arenicola]NIL43458.1 metal ABC transporter permease [Salinispora arenicola]TQL37513.1 zinc transport system permease protein [Salinispora arenicola]GIM86921.1 ABC transporter [Salinispora arenicola]
MELFQYPYMQRALIGALVIGLAAPALGIYLVQRRLALIGDGVGHVALTGVGAGLLLNRSPVLVAVIVASLGAIAIELVRARGRTSGDLALALLFYGGIAGGVMLVGLSDSTNASLHSYLFGSLSTISVTDLTTIAVLGVAILVTMLVLRPALFAIGHDEEYARVSGLPVRTLNLVLAVATAVTVTIAMRAVGVLLISALMVVPVAAAQQVTRGFRSTMTAAMALGLFAAGSGVYVAANADTAPGASVVLMAIASFAVVAIGGVGWRAWQRRRVAPADAPAVEPHEVVLSQS